ncbi:MAG: hypothetical protein HYY03_05380 [Chloroflexi bacterium]|nr:hypothetical protein [Chloroflexota bacterium]
MTRRGRLPPAASWLLRVAILFSLVVVTVLMSTGTAVAHSPRGYAIVYEWTNGWFRGAQARIDTANPDLGSGEFTNETLWAIDTDTCGGFSWVEGGWSKRAEWGGQLRYKFMYKMQPTCIFAKYNIYESPQYGSWHTYRIQYCDTCGPNAYWFLYIDDVWKAGVLTGWVFAEYLESGGEVLPEGIAMGPGNLWSPKYQNQNGVWTNWYGPDDWHCDPPEDPAYNAYFNSAADLYNWGYDLSGPGCVKL